MSKVVNTAHDLEKKWRSQDVRQKETTDFSTFHLNERVLAGLKNAGYKTPSPIQALAIPPGIFGRDLLVQAKSGTGKTLVFTVIALQSLLEIKYPQVLIMVPTREIAVQVRDCIRAVGSGIKGLKCCSFIGGLPVAADEENIVGCQIIVGTPGRLKQLISIGFIKTNSIRVLVLDEADTLLEQVFLNDLNFIFQSLPKFKQVIATSATYPNELKTFIRHYFKMNIFKARLNKKDFALLGMIHYAKTVPRCKLSLVAYKEKLTALEKILSSVLFTQCLVFCNLKSIVETLCCDIRSWGFTTTYISANKEQQARLKAIDNLKRFRCKVLVSSDVTARGIDAENVDLVINFDKPYKDETYFHRCGRAGRYGSKGVAVTLLTEDEMSIFKTNVEHKNFTIYNLPEPIPKNLINIRPAEKKPKEDSSDSEEQENPVDIISNGVVQDECKAISNKENSVHISEIEITKREENIPCIEDGKDEECIASNNLLLEKNRSYKSVNHNFNDLLLHNSEPVVEDINTQSIVESSCKSKGDNLYIECNNEPVVENVKRCSQKVSQKTKADENSCNLNKDYVSEDFELHKKTENMDSCHSSESRMLSNISNESRTLNIVVEQEKNKNGIEADFEAESIEHVAKVMYEENLEPLQIVDQINNSCLEITDSLQAEPVKVVHFSKLQKSLAKFLVSYEVKNNSKNFHDLNQCEALCGCMTSNTKEKENTQFKCDDAITEKCKYIKKDLDDFYHKVYKAYQIQSIDEASFKDFKASLMAEEDLKENETSKIIEDETDTTLLEHNYAKNPKLELESDQKKVPGRLLNKKSDTDSSDSSESSSPKSNLQSSLNVGDQTFADYIFKGHLPSKNIPEENSDSDGEKLLDNAVNKLSNSTSSVTSSSESKESCSSSCKLKSKVIKVSPKFHSKSSKTSKPEESSDSGSDSSNLLKKFASSSSESEDSFCSSSRKLNKIFKTKVSNDSKKCNPKSSHQNKMYDIPSRTFLNQEAGTSKNRQHNKKAYPIKDYHKNEYFCQRNGNSLEGKDPSLNLMHNGAKPKRTKPFHRNVTPSRSEVSYQQGLNKSSYISNSQEQKKAFRNTTYENSKFCNYNGEGNPASYPYNDQHYNYYTNSVTANQGPVSAYSNPQCCCCVQNTSCNNMAGDLYSIFLNQWKFIQNFSYPKH